MAHTTVFGICLREAQAMDIINQLKMAGFRNDDISALLPDKTGLRDFGYERHTKAPEGALWGGCLGLLLGAGLGWLAWLGVLPLEVLAPLVKAGVGVAALGCAALGTLAGGAAGAFIGLTRPEYEARRYNGKVPGDNILLSVHCENGRAVRWAKHIFQSVGAQAIGTRIEIAAGTARPVSPVAAAKPHAG